MNIKTFHRNEIIFHQGDSGDCMYEVQLGKVGIFLNYGASDEKKIAELVDAQIFGEMGLLDHAPRSATAVALTDDTEVEVISEEEFYEYFDHNPALVFMLMQQMCHRLRRTTKDYLEACNTVHEVLETEKTGKTKSASLQEKISKFCNQYLNFTRV